MSIAALNALAAPAQGATSITSATAALPKANGAEAEQRFLKLLVTQLNNQDPLNPLDNAQLTSQLAQMSTVTGIEKLNTAFESMLAQSGSSQVLQSANLIGRTVLVPGQDIQNLPGQPSHFGVDLPHGADAVTVSITAPNGDVVRSFDLGAQGPGVQTLAWDGLGANQAALPAGNYRVNVEARIGEGKVAAEALAFARVGSVSQGASGTGGVTLDLASGVKAPLSAVRLIL